MYKRVQALFEHKRKKLAEEILDGQTDVRCPLSVQEVEEHYREKLGTIRESGSLRDYKYEGRTDVGVLNRKISSSEVKRAITSTPRQSAAGPHKVALSDIWKWDPNGRKLAIVFEGMRRFESVPDSWKTNRSILLPKSDDPDKLQLLKNWCPVTIGNHLLRVYTKIIAQRMSKAVPLNVRQKGFVKARGCYENVYTLWRTIRHAKESRKGLYVVFIDLAKAFDSIPHTYLLDSLDRVGIPSGIRNIISNLYANSRKEFTVRRGVLTSEIPILSGVKQGDPLSPVLFNIALITTLEGKGQGATVGGAKYTCLAFTDDTVLVSHDWQAMQENLSEIERFCGISGLRVNVDKCSGFHIRPYRKTFLINTERQWTLDGCPIPLLQPGDTTRYLGTSVDPWSGITSKDWVWQLSSWKDRIDSYPLKPRQRLELLVTYTVPRVRFDLTLTPVKMSVPSRLDEVLVRTTKRWLHLHPSTANHMLY